MKLWRVGLGSFLAAVVFACGGRAEGDGDEPRAPVPGGNGPTTAAPTAPPPAYRGTTAPPPAASNAPPDRAPLSGPATELQLVEAMLGRYCGDCHGEAAIRNDNVMGGFDFVEDIEALVQTGYIIPLDAERSLLLQRIRNGDMPPRGVTPRPSQTEIRAFESFIEGDDLQW